MKWRSGGGDKMIERGGREVLELGFSVSFFFSVFFLLHFSFFFCSFLSSSSYPHLLLV